MYTLNSPLSQNPHVGSNNSGMIEGEKSTEALKWSDCENFAEFENWCDSLNSSVFVKCEDCENLLE